jgi:hypothetical protein
MEITDMLQMNISSLQQAIGMASLRKALSQDAQSVATLMEGLQAANAKIMESSVTPYKGGSIDVRV